MKWHGSPRVLLPPPPPLLLPLPLPLLDYQLSLVDPGSSVLDVHFRVVCGAPDTSIRLQSGQDSSHPQSLA